jgi:hypothetical protein
MEKRTSDLLCSEFIDVRGFRRSAHPITLPWVIGRVFYLFCFTRALNSDDFCKQNKPTQAQILRLEFQVLQHINHCFPSVPVKLEE